jgi:DNA polymerase V
MDQDIEDMAGSDGVSIHTGFPNPALDRRGRQTLALDINQLLVSNPSSTYLFRVSGHRWSDQGIYDGDIAVVDRALRPRHSDLVLAWQDIGFAFYRRYRLPEEQEIWGVITAIIHQYPRD